jgi:hypothetical protein
MSLLLILIVVATALNGLLAGYSADGALVKLPTRHRIGAIAYVAFARGSDLGNGTAPLRTVGRRKSAAKASSYIMQRVGERFTSLPLPSIGPSEVWFPRKCRDVSWEKRPRDSQLPRRL